MPKDIKALSFVFIFAMVLILFENSFSTLCINGQRYLNGANPFFELTYAKNSGGAWGIFQDARMFLIIFSLLVIGCAIFYIYKYITFKQKFEILAFSLFIGGALGNLIERVRFGYVIDYFRLSFIDFPVFNIFDVCIVASVILFIFSYLRDIWKKK
ncbi:MAG: signal peptidase II [Cyanobacteria bacterium SIG30]|nr:signal peptidase II [Cyanobacteria bacterium SIG30]